VYSLKECLKIVLFISIIQYTYALAQPKGLSNPEGFYNPNSLEAFRNLNGTVNSGSVDCTNARNEFKPECSCKSNGSGRRGQNHCAELGGRARNCGKLVKNCNDLDTACSSKKQLCLRWTRRCRSDRNKFNQSVLSNDHCFRRNNLSPIPPRFDGANAQESAEALAQWRRESMNRCSRQIESVARASEEVRESCGGKSRHCESKDSVCREKKEACREKQRYCAR